MNGYLPAVYEAEKGNGDRLPNGVRPLKKLKPWHKNAIVLHLAGFSNGDIARVAHKTDATICILLQDPKVQEVIALAMQGHEAEFKALYGLTVDAIRCGLLDDDAEVKLKAAGVWLKEHTRLDERGETRKTAEDVISAIYNRIGQQVGVPGQINLQVNIGERHGPSSVS